MLVEGSTPPTEFEEYNGQVVHQKELDEKTSDLQTQIDSVNDTLSEKVNDLQTQVNSFSGIGVPERAITLAGSTSGFIFEVYKPYMICKNPLETTYGNSTIGSFKIRLTLCQIKPLTTNEISKVTTTVLQFNQSSKSMTMPTPIYIEMRFTPSTNVVTSNGSATFFMYPQSTGTDNISASISGLPYSKADDFLKHYKFIDIDGTIGNAIGF
jgi:hypothetical protein